MHTQMNEQKCDCLHHKIIPALIILFGLIFLLQGLGEISKEFVNIVWPVIVILGGLTKLLKGMCKCCSIKQ